MDDQFTYAVESNIAKKKFLENKLKLRLHRITNTKMLYATFWSQIILEVYELHI